MIRRACIAMTVALAAVVFAALPAGAHVGHGTNGLADGFLHPILGPDHLLAMVAVGVVAAGPARFAWWIAPVAFLVGMGIGGGAGLASWGLPAAETLILASVIALGLVVAGAVGHPGVWILPLLVLAGLAHGNAHGLEAPASVHPALYVVGFLAATSLLHVVGAAGGRMVRRQPQVRFALGALTSLTGVLLLTSS